MGCLVFALAMFFPRLTIILLALFTDLVSRAFAATGYPHLLPILGFVFMPYTTLAYVFGMIQHGAIDGVFQVILIVAVLVDLGVTGGGARARRKGPAASTD